MANIKNNMRGQSLFISTADEDGCSAILKKHREVIEKFIYEC